MQNVPTNPISVQLWIKQAHKNHEQANQKNISETVIHLILINNPIIAIIQLSHRTILFITFKITPMIKPNNDKRHQGNYS